MALLTILLGTSPILYANRSQPSILSRAISLQAVKLLRPAGSTYVVAIFPAMSTRLVQRSSEAKRKEIHVRFQKLASVPDGPATPFVHKAALRMDSASIH